MNEIPEVDKGQRFADNLDLFMDVHRAELTVMCAVLDQDADLVLMDMFICGFEEIKTRAMQTAEHDDMDYNRLVEQMKEFIKAEKEGKE